MFQVKGMCTSAMLLHRVEYLDLENYIPHGGRFDLVQGRNGYFRDTGLKGNLRRDSGNAHKFVMGFRI